MILIIKVASAKYLLNMFLTLSEASVYENSKFKSEVGSEIWIQSITSVVFDLKMSKRQRPSPEWQYSPTEACIE